MSMPKGATFDRDDSGDCDRLDASDHWQIGLIALVIVVVASTPCWALDLWRSLVQLVS